MSTYLWFTETYNNIYSAGWVEGVRQQLIIYFIFITIIYLD